MTAVREIQPMLPLDMRPDVEFARIVEESMRIVRKYPDIIKRIAGDQDAAALKAKMERDADQHWLEQQRAQKTATLDGLDLEQLRGRGPSVPEAGLGTGRPRLSPEAVYLCFVTRGLFGGMDSENVWSRLIDSITFNNYLWPRVTCFPSKSTVSFHLNSLSDTTRAYILQCQLAECVAMNLEDMEMIVIDSTHVYSRSAWPVDTNMIEKLLWRAFRLGQRLDAYGLANFQIGRCLRWFKELSGLRFVIDREGKRSSKSRIFRRTYAKFLTIARKLETAMGQQHEEQLKQVLELELCPSRRERLNKHWDLILFSLVDASILHDLAYARVVLGEEITRESCERIFSVSDRGAAFIEKGGREKVFGYRIQLARTRRGFISSFIVPEGNAADSAMLVPLVEGHIVNTKIVPAEVSTDDGYSSEAGRAILMEKGVRRVSINGSKGKKITPVEEWESAEYAELRRLRSAVESLMYTGKAKFRFAQFSRCGIDAVRAEMYEKVIAYNFWRLVLETQRQEQAQAA